VRLFYVRIGQENGRVYHLWGLWEPLVGGCNLGVCKRLVSAGNGTLHAREPAQRSLNSHQYYLPVPKRPGWARSPMLPGTFFAQTGTVTCLAWLSRPASRQWCPDCGRRRPFSVAANCTVNVSNRQLHSQSHWLCNVPRAVLH